MPEEEKAAGRRGMGIKMKDQKKEGGKVFRRKKEKAGRGGTKSRRGKRIRAAVLILALAAVVSPFWISRCIKEQASPFIKEPSPSFETDGQWMEEVRAFESDCILVLGAGLRPDGRPSYMLRDRMDRAIALYRAGAAPKLLLSGDHGKKHYDEVNAMRRYALEAGVPAEDLFLDHAGFTTYDSVARAKAVFQVQRPIIVTQRYHQYRAVYLALGFFDRVMGIPAEGNNYAGQKSRDIRETAACVKAFLFRGFRPKPAFLGDPVPIGGDGRSSWDEGTGAEGGEEE